MVRCTTHTNRPWHRSYFLPFLLPRTIEFFVRQEAMDQSSFGIWGNRMTNSGTTTTKTLKLKATMTTTTEVIRMMMLSRNCFHLYCYKDCAMTIVTSTMCLPIPLGTVTNPQLFLTFPTPKRSIGLRPPLRHRRTLPLPSTTIPYSSPTLLQTLHPIRYLFNDGKEKQQCGYEPTYQMNMVTTMSS